jgi:hypothetical protein
VITYQFLLSNIYTFSSYLTGNILLLRFDYRKEKEIFIFFTASILVLRPTQPPFQWVPGSIYLGVRRLEREADHSSSSIAEIKKYGAVPPLFHTSS